MAKTAKQMAIEIKTLEDTSGSRVAEWAKDYGNRVVIQLAGCGRVRKGARMSIEQDGRLDTSKMSETELDAYAESIALIRAVVA